MIPGAPEISSSATRARAVGEAGSSGNAPACRDSTSGRSPARRRRGRRTSDPRRLRGYLLWKCGGLDADGIRATLRPLDPHARRAPLKHAAVVEAITLAWKLHGWRPFAPFGDADWDDADWHVRVEDDDTPEALDAALRRVGGAGPGARR